MWSRKKETYEQMIERKNQIDELFKEKQSLKYVADKLGITLVHLMNLLKKYNGKVNKTLEWGKLSENRESIWINK